MPLHQTQLRKLASDPQPEKNIHATLLSPLEILLRKGGEKKAWPFVWDFSAVSSLPRAILCSKLPSPWKCGQMAIVSRTVWSSKGKCPPGLCTPGSSGCVVTPARCHQHSGTWLVCVGCACHCACGSVSGFPRWECCSWP